MTDHGYLYDLMRELGMSDFAASTVEFLLLRPLKILLILVIAMVLGRLAARVIRRALRTALARSPLRAESARAQQRAQTLGDVLAGLVRAIIMGVAGLVVLDELGLNLAPLLAGAGIAGIAIGFGAQSLVKDFLSGFFVIAEDQYGVGDVVDLGGTRGTVEALTMRVTRLRSVDGTVWFVPNGEVRTVGNTSMEWSRALLDVLVPYDVDMAQVTAAIQDEAERLAAEDAWRAKVLEPPAVWGVQHMGPEGLTVRLVVKTAPREQDDVERELLTRISGRLRRDGVRSPGQTMVITAGALDQGAPATAPPDLSD